MFRITGTIPNSKDDIIQAFCDAIHKKPETTFGNVKADVLADKDPSSWQLLQRHPQFWLARLSELIARGT